MANLAALVLLLVVATAVATTTSAYTTVVITTTVMEDGVNMRDSCRVEMKEKMPMHKCMMWMETKMRRGPFNGDDAFLRSAVANPRYREEEHLDECCSEIKRFSSPCRCDAIKEMMMMTKAREEMERAVCSLPNKCGIDECGRCGSFA